MSGSLAANELASETTCEPHHHTHHNQNSNQCEVNQGQRRQAGASRQAPIQQIHQGREQVGEQQRHDEDKQRIADVIKQP